MNIWNETLNYLFVDRVNSSNTFIKKVNQPIAKLPLNFNGSLAYPKLTSLLKSTDACTTMKTSIFLS